MRIVVQVSRVCPQFARTAQCASDRDGLAKPMQLSSILQSLLVARRQHIIDQHTALRKGMGASVVSFAQAAAVRALRHSNPAKMSSASVTTNKAPTISHSSDPLLLS